MWLPALDDIARALAFHAFRQGVLANDLANAGTPGFLAQDVDPASAFRDVLDGTLALARTDQRHLSADAAGSAGAETALIDAPVLAGPSGNGVDPDAAMAALSSNALAYRALAAAAGAEITMARTGITG